MALLLHYYDKKEALMTVNPGGETTPEKLGHYIIAYISAST
jgi:hypothetical protein